MKLKFKNQAFQMDAVNAVVDLFAGQEKTRSTFSVMEEAQTNFLNELGQGNALYIDQETLTANMHTVQKRNNLPLTPTAEGCQFCIEMETGTGKTYVYTKTIFELKPQVRIHQVCYRGAVGGHPGGRLQILQSRRSISACNTTTCHAGTSSTTLPSCPTCGNLPPVPISK